MAPFLNPDYYQILDVPSTATITDIKRAYRRSAMKCHPDKNPTSSTATAQFQLIVEAWEVLSDDIKRRLYDVTYRPSCATSGANSSTKNAGHEPQPHQSSYSSGSSWEKNHDENDLAKDRAFVDFLEMQDEKLEKVRGRIAGLESQIRELRHLREKAEQKIQASKSWWNWFGRLSSCEVNQIEVEILDKGAAIRVKNWKLEQETEQLTRLLREREVRVAADEQRRAQRQQEEQRQRYQQRQREEQQRKEQQRAEAERMRQTAKEERQKNAEQQTWMDEEWQNRWERVQEELRRKNREANQEQYRRENANKAGKDGQQTRSGGQQSNAKTRFNGAPEASTNPSLCTHSSRKWWTKVDGAHRCAKCEKMLRRFAFECPQCRTVACHSCMHVYKASNW